MITASINNGSTLSCVVNVEEKKFTVTFKDFDGVILSAQTVVKGNAAIEPSEPNRAGYTFIGWDTDFSNITSDTIVTALYEMMATPTPTPTVAPTATPVVTATAMPTVTPTVPENTTTIYYKGYSTPYIHYKVGSGSWTSVPGIAMTQTSE